VSAIAIWIPIVAAVVIVIAFAVMFAIALGRASARAEADDEKEYERLLGEDRREAGPAGSALAADESVPTAANDDPTED